MKPLMTRQLELLPLIKQGLYTSKQMAESLKRPITTVRRHVTELEECGLVKKRREGKWRIIEVSERARNAMTKISRRPETARETAQEMAKLLRLEIRVVMTPEEQKEKERKRLQKRREKHPEAIKRNMIRSLERKVKRPGFFENWSRENYMVFCKFTRLLFGDVLPKKCARCGAESCLHIHHKVYEYPLKIEDVERICRHCHDAHHYCRGEMRA